MPELPEVETVKNGLNKFIVGKAVAGVSFDWPKGFPNSASSVDTFLVGATVRQVRRRAKVLIIQLSSGYSLVIHLKMTGQMVYVGNGAGAEVPGSLNDRFGAGHPNDSLIGSLPDKSTRVIFTFSDGAHLYFNDQRKFGWVRLLPTVEVDQMDFMKKLGPEPLGEDFNAKQFVQRLQRRKNSAIKAVILDQSVIAGIGNIYADESLWGAKVHPATTVANVSTAKLNKLFNEIVYVLRLSIEKGGSSDKNYVNAEGKKGSYLQFARVFRREKLPCPRCATVIQKTRVAGRGTHFCPKCQKVKT